MLKLLEESSGRSGNKQGGRHPSAGSAPRPPRTPLRGGDPCAGARGVGHAGRTHPHFFLSGLAAALVAACVIVFSPFTALAQGDTLTLVVGRLHPLSEHSRFLKSSSGQVVYCGDADAEYPPNKTKYNSWAPGSSALDYLVYYAPGGPGYSGSFFGAKGQYAQVAAQYAIWNIMGTPRSQGFDDSSTHVPSAIKTAIAKAHAAGKGPWSGCSRVYKSPSKSIQQICVCGPTKGKVKLHKASANPLISDGLATYSLGKATYSVYSDKACTKKVGELVCDDTGTSNELELVAGTYWVRETAAPTGYAKDTTTSTVKVDAGKTSTLDLTDKPQVNKLGVIVRKIDRELQKNAPLGSASLAGAQYTVRYYDGYYNADNLPKTPKRTWTVVTGEDGVADISTISGDARYQDSAGNVVCPLGTVAIQETKAPRGYVLGKAPVHIVQVTAKGDAEYVETYLEPTDPEQVVRGDINFSKHDDDGTGGSMAEVVFLVTSKTTGEAHVVVADEDGMVDTSADWNPHTRNTNANDAALVRGEDGLSVDEDKLDPAAGVWFGQAKLSDGSVAISAPDDSLGALPYDNSKDGGGYTIEELRSSANASHDLVSTSVSVSRNKVDLDLGTFDDDEIRIHTTATVDGNHDAPAAEEQVVTDLVSYENLTPGHTYTMRGRLMGFNAESGEPVELATAETEFKAEKSEGKVKLVFPAADLGPYAGGRVVAYETLLEKGHELVTHENPDDVDQTVYVPVIHTQAAGASSEQIALAGSDTTLTDTVHYEGLLPKTTYTATATLHRATSAPLGGPIDSGTVGSPITVSFTTPAAADGEGSVSGDVEVPITAYLADNAGDKLVVYEEVAHEDGTVIATHTDLNAESQTVQFPDVHTELTAEDGSHKVDNAERFTLTDTVTYTNLIPGLEYQLTGTLHLVKKDGTDGGQVTTAKTSFTPEEADGTATVTFEVDAGSLDLKDCHLVACEELSLNGDVVAQHADLTDEAQTVTVGSAPELPSSDVLPQTSDLVLPVSFFLVAGGIAVAVSARLRARSGAPRHIRPRK